MRRLDTPFVVTWARSAFTASDVSTLKRRVDEQTRSRAGPTDQSGAQRKTATPLSFNGWSDTPGRRQPSQRHVNREAALASSGLPRPSRRHRRPGLAFALAGPSTHQAGLLVVIVVSAVVVVVHKLGPATCRWVRARRADGEEEQRSAAGKGTERGRGAEKVQNASDHGLRRAIGETRAAWTHAEADGVGWWERPRAFAGDEGRSRYDMAGRGGAGSSSSRPELTMERPSEER